MPRPRNLTPTYTLHKQSGRGRLIWTDTAGVRHEKLLPGEYGSEESLAAKARLELELATSPTRNVTESNDITIAELIAAYMKFAARYYADADGKPTKELENMRVATNPVWELYAETLAKEFGPRALAAVRQHMIGLGWCRTLINHNIDRIRRAMKWAASEELIPVATYQALRTLAGLRRGRTDAGESDPVKPVAEEVVKATRRVRHGWENYRPGARTFMPQSDNAGFRPAWRDGLAERSGSSFPLPIGSRSPTSRRAASRSACRWTAQDRFPCPPPSW